MNHAASARSAQLVISSQPAAAGTLAVRRALPDRERKAVGPWVFLDHFGPARLSGGDGVGPHPHAGIETVTYLLEGRNEHRDSAGHTGIVSAGGAQWMTAGRGIVHAERPLVESDGEAIVHGIQLWTSLPRALKMMPPGYQRIEASAIARSDLPGASLRVIAGEVSGVRGPAVALMPLFLAHATLDPGARIALDVAPCFEAGAYVIAGRGAFGSGDARVAGAGELAVYADEGGVLEAANTGSEPLEALFLGGAPAEGPLVFHGPFVMNSVEQVRAAEIAFRTGRMGTLAES
ncbi:MAG: pirin family protein [Betaproteobacteria bacterium]|nr:pirin family protein [Betaproteobacteria bacterium]